MRADYVGLRGGSSAARKDALEPRRALERIANTEVTVKLITAKIILPPINKFVFLFLKIVFASDFLSPVPAVAGAEKKLAELLIREQKSTAFTHNLLTGPIQNIRI